MTFEAGAEPLPDRLDLTLQPWRLSICRLAPDDPLPAWAPGGAFHSITRTPFELSIVCETEAVPDGVRQEKGWRCLAVRGPLPFEMTGVLASLAAPLSVAGVSVFAVSTFDTDYLLVREGQVEQAVAALRAAGHGVQGAVS